MAAAVEHSPALTEPAAQRVLSVRHFEAAPPANLNQGLADGDVIATTKEEEWVTKKKVELTTTRQIETRVQRQLVLEDGKVVEDSGPIVSTNTTEDTEKQEHKHTEHRTTGDDPPGEGWLAIPTEGEGLIKEVRERTVHSKEETQELLETEDVQHLGDLSDEAYLSSVRTNQDVLQAVQSASTQALQTSEGPRVVHQSSRSRRVVDTEDAQELSRVREGHVVTETRRTTEHEEERGEHVPEDEGAASEEEREVNHREGTQRYAHTKEQDLVQFLGTGGRKIAEHMRYSAENVEGATEGDPDPEWESLSTRMQRMRRHQPGPAAVGSPLADPTSAESASAAARKDALTKRPLDFDQEEETRKAETSKWLEHHFGSESRSSKSSVDDEPPAVPSGAHFINVTMKSRPISGTRVVRATPSPRPTSPAPATFSPARVFLSSPEVDTTPAPPPPPVMPTSIKQPVNGRQNSGSSAGSAGFFQGVSEWSERSHGPRQDRVQVLPTGPGHTFNPAPSGQAVTNNFVNSRVNGFINHQSSSLSHSHVNGSASPTMVVPPAPLHQSQRLSPHMNGTTSPQHFVHHLNGVASPQHFNHVNGVASPQNFSRMNGATSPPPQTTDHRLSGSVSPSGYPPHLNGRVSPSGYPSAQRPISPPQGYRSFEEEEGQVWRGRATSPPRQTPRSAPRERRGSAELLEPRAFVTVPRTERRGSADLHRTERRGSAELLRVERRYSSPPPRELEPPPDYSPGHRRRSRVTSSPSPSPPPHEHSRKSNQKTRFADPPPQKTKSSFGDSLRRFVGKFRSSDDKSKKRKSSRTTSPSRSYRAGAENNNIPSSASRRLRVGRGESPPNEAVRRGYSAEQEEEVYSDEEEGGMTSPVPPPRVRQRQPSPHHHHQLDPRHSREHMMEPRRFYLGEDPFGGSIYGREKEYDGVTPPARSSRNGRHHSHRSRRGSQHDDETVSTQHGRNVAWHEEVRGGRTSPPRTGVVSSSTLGRYSRSTGRLHSQLDEGGTPRSTQTLPRKLHRDEPPRVVTSPTHVTRTVSSSHWESGRLTRAQPNTSGSMINVSIINNVTPTVSGPAKPARTYRSSLARSQSFNVAAGSEAPPPRRLFQQQQQANKSASFYRSNPHLHRLDEASSTLKSPGLISSISRSQRDLNEAVKRETLIEEEENNKFSPRLGAKSPAGTFNGSNIIGGNLQESKKKLFMKGLLDRAPELYRTLHGDEAGPLSPSAPHATSTPHRVDYSSSFRGSDSSQLTPGVRPARGRRSTTSPTTPLHNGDAVRTLVSPSQSFRSHTSGNGSNDYSETVRITSTSDDPVRPSVTNTVQSFSKKTVASPRSSGGVATETIESTETTTVTKSRVRDPQSTSFISGYSSNSLGKNKFLMDQHTAASPMRNGGVVIEVRNNNR